MRQYKTYKPSCIEWLGDIPLDWEIKRLKQNTYLKGRIGWQNLRADEFVDEGPYCITGTDFKDGIINWETSYRVTEERYEIDHNIHLEEGDLIITKDGTIGKVARVENMPYKATLNSGIMLIRPTTSTFHTHFLYWILNSEVFYQFNEYTKSGSTILHLYQNVFERMPFPVPTIQEQTTIANYLDEKTSKLDQLISNKNAQIEKLKEIRQIEINTAVTKGLDPNVKLKPSGIEWLGDIPQHWEVNRLKNVSINVQTGTTPKTAILRYYEDEDIKWFTPVDFTKNIRLTNSKSKVSQIAIDEGAGRLFPSGSVLLLGIGATIGKVGLITEDSSSNQQINCITFNAKIDSLFAAFSLKIYETEIIKIANFSTMPIFNQSNTANLKICIPPLEEQTAIANYLDEKTSKLDNLVSNLENQIEQLEEVRKIEIYNVVTGKIKVLAA